MYDGIRLWETASHFKLPHPDLLDFHLQCSVMAHMPGSSEYEEDFNGPESDYYFPEMQLVEAY